MRKGRGNKEVWKAGLEEAAEVMYLQKAQNGCTTRNGSATGDSDRRFCEVSCVMQKLNLGKTKGYLCKV